MEGTCWTLLVKRGRVFLEHSKLLKLLFLSDTHAIFILCSILFGSPHFSDTVFWICIHLSRKGEKTGCPFTEATCWTLRVKRWRVFLEHAKLLFLSDSLTIYILFSMLFCSPHFLTQFAVLS
jgi:hypothetical protein